jgi:hypothetical protein
MMALHLFQLQCVVASRWTPYFQKYQVMNLRTT